MRQLHPLRSQVPAHVPHREHLHRRPVRRQPKSHRPQNPRATLRSRPQVSALPGRAAGRQHEGDLEQADLQICHRHVQSVG